MAQPTQLTPTEQDALVKQIGLAMLRVAPDDWEQLTVDYRAVGRYAESTGQVTYSDGTAEPWEMPADLRGLFARLRGGMYREGRGTWFNARYKLDHPSSYNLEYDREEPVWDAPPPPAAYPDDMRLFPRSDENVPEWLRRRLASAPPPPPPGPPPGGPGPGPDRPLGPATPRFRVARIFDGPGEDGRPSVNRPQVDEIDIPELLDYLDNAPLVGPARGYDVDRLDPNGQQSVPVAFHTDGTWIWPAAVNYYLREHDIAPEPELVDHIRRMRFKLVPVDEQVRSAAQLFLGPPPGAPRPGPPAPAPTRALPVPPPAPAPPPPPAVPAPPRAALPSQGPPAQQIVQLRARLEDLDVPESAYRIGAPTGRGWVMEQTDEGWRVGWHDHDWVAPAMFEDVADASAFLLGKLLLDTDRWAAGPKNPELQAPLAPEDRGFEPMSAPIEAFEPMSAPIDDFSSSGHGSHAAPAGPVGPPPGTPGYASPPPGTPGFTDTPGRFAEPGRSRQGSSDSGRSGVPSYSDSFAEPSQNYSNGFAESAGKPGYSDGFSESPDKPGYSGGFAEQSGTPGYSDSPNAHGLSGPSKTPGYSDGFSEPSGKPDYTPGFSEPAGPGYSDSPGAHGLSEPAGTPSYSDSFSEPSGKPGYSSDSSSGHGFSEPSGQPGYSDSPGAHGFSEPSGQPSYSDSFSEPSGKPGYADSPGRSAGTPGYSNGLSDSSGQSGYADSPGRSAGGAGYSNGLSDSSGQSGYADSPGHSSGTPGYSDGLSDSPGTPGYADSPGRAGTPGYSDGFSEPGRSSGAPGFSEPGFAERSDSPGFTEPAGSPSYSGSSNYSDSPGAHGFSEPSDKPEYTPPGFGDPSGKPGFSEPGKPSYADSPGFGDRSDSPGFGEPSDGFAPPRPGPPPGTPPRPKPAPTMAMEQPSRGGEPRGEQATVLASRPTNGAAAAPAGSEWPIAPLPGEPPLTLFRGKRVIELEPGMEIDRYGEDDGNLVYAAGTPFPERSLVPEWIDRPYHAYRVRQSFQALTGAAIPWFDQPGGGTAFLLPDAIGDLVAHGHLVEIDGRDRPQS